MVNPRVDEQSMMTYLSQFPNAKLNPDAPVRPRSNAARVRAYGPGKLSSHFSCSDICISSSYYNFDRPLFGIQYIGIHVPPRIKFLW